MNFPGQVVLNIAIQEKEVPFDLLDDLYRTRQAVSLQELALRVKAERIQRLVDQGAYLPAGWSRLIEEALRKPAAKPIAKQESKRRLRAVRRA